MATVLLFTALYPQSGYESRIDQTFAIHNLVKHWKDERLLVVKPVRVRVKNISRIMRVESSTLDGISIVAIPFLQVPVMNFPCFVFFNHILSRVLADSGITPDAVVSHYDISHILGASFKRKRGIPHIAVVHNSDLNRIADKTKTGKKVYSSLLNADTIGFRSTQLKRRFIEFTGSGNKLPPTEIIASGIDSSEILSAELFQKKAHRDTLNIVTVAALKKRKNIVNVIQALAGLRKYSWIYTVIGSGDEYHALAACAKQNELSERITFAGLLDHEEVMRRLENADIFVLPSEGETFGLVYLEAMAKGCVVVALKNDGIDGVIVNGINGYLCETSSTDDIQKTLAEVMRMDDKARCELLQSSFKTINDYTETKRSSLYHSVVIGVISESEKKKENR